MTPQLAGRAEAVRAVAKRYLDDEMMPYWSDDEFLHGQVRLIVDVFGVDPVEEGNERSAVYDEITKEWQRMKLEAAADAWVRLATSDITQNAVETTSIRALIKRAYLAGVDSTKEQ